MNAYYNDIPACSMTAAPRRARASAPASPSVIDKLLTRIDAALAAMSRAVSRSRVAVIARVAVTTLCFFGCIGVIGGLEADRLSWPAGFAIVAALAVIEGVCLRRLKK